MNIQKVENLINLISTLSTEEVEFLKSQLNSNVNKNNNIEFSTPNCCSHCGSIKFHKHDKRNNKQRYKCYDCKKTFTSTTSSTLNYLHQSHYDKFKKFIECAINNLSLKRTAEICNISVSCAFNWRHKIINYLTNKQQSNEFISGLIEMDEIYFRNSKKGNFKNGIGRKSRRHGYVPHLEDSVGLSKDKVCITTAIDRTKNISVNFIGFGKPNAEILYNNYKDKIIEPNNSKVITDGDRVYLGFTKQIGCELKMLSKHNSNNHKIRKMPVIESSNGIRYHIQNINNFHSQIKDILNNKFKGVSSKYLVQYINWVKWLRLNKSEFYLMVDKLVKEVV